MIRGVSDKITYKPYNQGEQWLLPPSLDELVPLKVLIYCYMTGTYSPRQIAKQCRENVNVIWLTGFQKPDFRTINTFRSEKLKDSIEEIFVSTVKLLNRKNIPAPAEIQFLTERQ